jgi:ferrous iron transport protein B
MALTYSLALVLPIVGTFFVAFGALEDSGYLPRLAVMVDALFRRMGLNGKAVLPMVLGLGCDTMATLTTRILETPRERLIVIVLLALGVPCSAQLTVVLALLGPLTPAAIVLWALVVVSVIVLVGRLAAAVLPGRSSDFVLELPPLRLPRPGNIAIKTLGRIEWYLKEAVPLFVLGTLILFVADRLALLGGVQRLAEPVVSGMLGLPAEAAAAFVVGFLRRDFGAAGLYALAREGRLDAVQSLVAAVTITLFIPCIANFFMMVKERGWRTALAVAAFILPFAVGVGTALRLLLDAVRP